MPEASLVGDRLEAARKLYISLSDEPSPRAAALRVADSFGVKPITITRYAKKHDWEVARKTAIELKGKIDDPELVESGVTATHAVVAGSDLDMKTIISDMVQDLAIASKATDAKSKEGAANAAARLIDAYRTLCPITYDDLVDACLAMPGFSPREFALHLKRRVEGG